MHEQSQTVERDGRFFNVHGKTQQPLTPQHSFERESYDTLEEAVSAAERRSAVMPHTVTGRELQQQYTQERLSVDDSPIHRLDREMQEKSAREAAGEPASEERTPPANETQKGMGIVPGVGEIATEAWRGFESAVNEMGQFVEWAARKTLGEEGLGLPRGPVATVPTRDKMPEPETLGGGLVRGVSQFLTGLAPFMGPVQTAVKGTLGAGRMAHWAGTEAASAISSALAFDPNDPRLSNLLNQVLPEALRNPVTEYLAAQPGDSEAEGRFKNAVEGLGLGVVAEGLILGVRALRSWRSANAALKKVEQGQAAAGAVDVELGATKTAPVEAPGAPGSIPETPRAPGVQETLDAAQPTPTATTQAQSNRSTLQASQQLFSGKPLDLGEVGRKRAAQRYGAASEPVFKAEAEARARLEAGISSEAKKQMLAVGAGAAAGGAADGEEGALIGATVGATRGRVRLRAALPALAEDLTKALKGNSVLFNDLASVGSAVLWRGGDFKAQMVEEFGDGILPHLARIQERAAKNLAEKIFPAADNKMPSVKKVLGLLIEEESGFFKGQDWYAKAAVELQQLFGENWTKVADLIAATSPNTPVALNVRKAFQAFEDFLAGKPVEQGLKDMYGENIERALRGEPISGPKIGPFAQAIKGDPNAVVIDIWMMRAFGFTKPADGVPTEVQRMFMTKAVMDGAAQMGITPRQFQAALWVGKKLLDEGPKSDVSDLDAVVRRVIEWRRSNGLVSVPGLADEGGSIDQEVLLAVARGLVGAGTGAALGDTPEEKFQFAMLGMGIALSPEAVKGVGKFLRSKDAQQILMNERGSIQLGPKSAPRVQPVKASEFPEMAKRYQDEVAIARREAERPEGQSRRYAEAEAARMGWDLETVQRIMPGSAANDAEALATIRVLTDSGLRLKALAAQVKAGDAASAQELLKQLWTHGTADPKRMGVVAEAGRTLSIMNDPVSGYNRFLDQFSALFERKDTNLSPERLADIITTFKSPEQLAVFARQVTKPTMWDMVHEAWINGLLSGPKTHVANFIGNTLTTAWGVAERGVAANVPGFLRKGEGGVQHGEAIAMLRGMYGALGDAWRMAAKAWELETSAFGNTKVETRHRAISNETLKMSGDMGRAVDLLGTMIRLPGRALMFSDELFKVINYRAELRALSLREAREVVQREGLTGAKAKARADAIIADRMANPDAYPQLKKAAEEYAAFQTFTNNLGEFGSGIQQAATRGGMRWVVPFTRTPMNIFNYAFERTPLEIVTNGFREEIKQGGAARDMALAKIALGSATMGMAAMFAADGVISGGGPKNKVARKMLEDTGWQPYSIKVGSKWVSFNRLDPIGMLLGLSADMAEVTSNGPEGADYDQVALATVLAVANNFTSKSFVQGLARVIDAISDPERYGEQFLQSFAGTLIPYSGLVKTAEELVDPAGREAQGMVDAWKSKIPGLSSALPPRRNFWGEPILSESGFWPVKVTGEKDAPVSKEIARLQRQGLMNLDMPSETMEGIRLSPEEYDRRVVLHGNEAALGGLGMKDRLSKLVESERYQKFSDERRELEIKRVISAYRKYADQQLLKEFPDLKLSVNDARRSAAQALFTPMSDSEISALTNSLSR